MASSSGGPSTSTIVLIGVGAAAAVCSFFLIKHLSSDTQETEAKEKKESKPKKRAITPRASAGTTSSPSPASSPPAASPLPETKIIDNAELQRADRERRKLEADRALAESLERRREEERAEAERRAAVAKRDEEMREKMRLKRQEEETKRKALEEEARRKAAEEAAERQRLHELEREHLRKREAEEKKAQEEMETRKEEAERRRLHDRERILREQQRVLAQTQGETEVPVSSESLMSEADEAAIREAQERSEAEERALLAQKTPTKSAALDGTPKQTPTNGLTVLTNGHSDLHNLSDDESDCLSPLSPTGLNGSTAVNHREGTMGSALFPHPNGSIMLPSDSATRPRAGSGSALQSSTTSFLPPLMRSASLPEDSSLRKSSITFSEDEFPDLSQTRPVAAASGGDSASPQAGPLAAAPVIDAASVTPVKEAQNFWSKNPLTRSPSSTSTMAQGAPPPLRRATTSIPRSSSMGQQPKRPMPNPLVDFGRSPLKTAAAEPAANGQSVLSLSSSLSSSASAIPTPAPVVERPVRGPLRRSFTVSNTASLPGSSSMSGSISLISHSAADSAT